MGERKSRKLIYLLQEKINNIAFCEHRNWSSNYKGLGLNFIDYIRL